MNAKTLEALKGSIKKWEKVFDGEEEGDCPLCDLFNDDLKDNCNGCPIKIRTGKSMCHGSPYYNSTIPYSDYTQAMIDFLKSLLPEVG